MPKTLKYLYGIQPIRRKEQQGVKGKAYTSD